MVRVGVLGAAGRMGAEVCRAVSSSGDLELVAAVDPLAAGRPLHEVVGMGAGGEVVVGDRSALEASGAEVAVDFTDRDASVANLEWCAEHGLHAVCGTTGMDPVALGRLRAIFEDPAAPNALVAPNFALSAVLLMRLAELAAPFFDGVEVIELHHAGKADAPSGTAIETARRLAAARAGAGSDGFEDRTETERIPGSRGALAEGGIRVHAVRLPGLVAHEEVIFGASGQSLTLRQDSYDRTSFMPGVLLAIRKVASTPGFTFGLDSLLGW